MLGIMLSISISHMDLVDIGRITTVYASNTFFYEQYVQPCGNNNFYNSHIFCMSAEQMYVASTDNAKTWSQTYLCTVLSMGTHINGTLYM